MMKITASLARMSTPELLPLASCLLPIPTQILFQQTRSRVGILPARK
ncbi:hypothetical protein [Moorena producens]|nr:hypothetical protein [Moorena producens]